MKLLGWVLGGAVFLLVLPDLLVGWHESMAELTTGYPEPHRTILLLVVDPLEYVWKWVIAIAGGIGYGVSRLRG